MQREIKVYYIDDYSIGRFNYVKGTYYRCILNDFSNEYKYYNIYFSDGLYDFKMFNSRDFNLYFVDIVDRRKKIIDNV